MAKRFNLRMEVRRRRVIELHVQGDTIPEIVQKLTTENIKTSERTVWEDLHSEMAEDYLSPFAEELIRKQNKDIEATTNPNVRLRARDRLIGRVLPRRQIIKTEVKGSPGMDAGDAMHSLAEKLFADDAHIVSELLKLEKARPLREAPQGSLPG